jgi:hypothetical protein
MSIIDKIWRATLGRFADWLGEKTEQRLLRKSLDHPLVHFSRETMIYYEKGRSVSISSDFGTRESKLDYVIYKQTPLAWNNTGKLLTPEETDRVYSKLSSLLASQNIRWAYSEMVHKR